MEQKGLLVDIFRSDYNSSLNVYGKYKKAVLLGVPECPFSPSDDAPALRIVKRFIGGRDYVHAEPLEKGMYAYGGSFVYCSDSRFPMDYPIPLHDYDMSRDTQSGN